MSGKKIAIVFLTTKFIVHEAVNIVGEKGEAASSISIVFSSQKVIDS